MTRGPDTRRPTSRFLGVSNLAWPARAEARALALLAGRGAQGIEVAPTRIAEWADLTPQRLAAFRQGCAQAGLLVSSLQAIFYLRPEASLLGDPSGFAAMCDHMERVAGIAGALGAGVAVFGAPKSRLRGTLSPEDAMQRGAERLHRLGDLAAAGGLVLGMEPVPAAYGGDFLTHARDIVEIVRRTDHPAVRAHLDTACVSLGGDDVAEAIRSAAPVLAHYHMAEPQLGPFAAPVCDHALAGATLDEINYAGWVVIEMREVQAPDDGLGAIGTAIDYARTHYVRAAVA
jgi:D-psicose/D-tagatose/L-ribulose 3-epimerase